MAATFSADPSILIPLNVANQDASDNLKLSAQIISCIDVVISPGQVVVLPCSLTVPEHTRPGMALALEHKHEDAQVFALRLLTESLISPHEQINLPVTNADIIPLLVEKGSEVAQFAEAHLESVEEISLSRLPEVQANGTAIDPDMGDKTYW